MDTGEVAACPPTGPTGTEVGDIIENQTLTRCDGTPVELHSLCGADAGLVFLYFGWCGPCNEFAKKANDLYERYRDDGLEFIFVVKDQRDGQPPTAEYCQQIQDQAGLTMTVVYDPTAQTTVFDDASSVYMVTDEEARIVYKNPYNEIMGLAAIEAELGDEEIPTADQIVDDDFEDGALDTSTWVPITRGTDSVIGVDQGVVAATAADDGSFEGLVQSSLWVDDLSLPPIKALQADLRIPGDTQGTGHVELAGYPFHSGLYQGSGSEGNVFAYQRMATDGTVSALLWHCFDTVCAEGEVLGYEEVATGVDVTAWHSLSLGCDETTATCYFGFDDQVTAIELDGSAYPDATWEWAWAGLRTVSGDANEVLGEYDNARNDTIDQIFGPLD